MFNNEPMGSNNKVITFIKNQIQNWKTNLTDEDDYNIKQPKNYNSNIRKKHNIKWDKPKPSFFKLNFDGSKLDSGITSIGFVIRNHNGDVVSLDAKKK